MFLDRISNNIEIFHSPPAHEDEAPNNFMLIIQRALADKKTLNLCYRAAYSKQLINNRIVEPVGLCFYSMAWHLVAFCRLRNDYRDFRLDRIVSLSMGSETYRSREIKSVKDFFQRNLSEYHLENITISMPLTQSLMIQTTRYYYGYIGEEIKGDRLEINFITGDLQYFCRWLLMYADVVEIVQNDALRNMFVQLIAEIKKRFS
jgi:predicted DNA-binding transcriptional regulator YafY